MTYLEKAEHLVRNHPANKKLMELGFGCEVHVKVRDDWFKEGNKFTIARDGVYGIELVENQQCSMDKDNLQILGKPAHLEHYLRVLDPEQVSTIQLNGTRYLSVIQDGTSFLFNLTTGKPATENDAEAFINLVQ